MGQLPWELRRQCTQLSPCRRIDWAKPEGRPSRESLEAKTPIQCLQRIAGVLDGASATDDDIQLLRSRLPATLTPDWLMSILREYRLAGICFGLSEEHDRSGLGADVTWLTPGQIVSESCDAEPGISVLPCGFLPIGACATGSGDPYFLDLRQASSDPPVVRVPHDYAGRGPYPLNKVEVVSSSLSQFFGNARF
jgi:hypothetical protein